MSLTLVIVPQQSGIRWIDFKRHYPRHSIALDGFVYGRPRYDEQGRHRNFNHHEEVDRHATRSTCAQVLNAIRLGLLKAFPIQSAEVTVYVNDCDEDVCLSWWILNHVYLTDPHQLNLNRLTAIEDMLDATGGMYPYNIHLPVLGEMAWIFEPYRSAREYGRLDAPDPMVYREVIDAVCDRIDQYMAGRCHSRALDTKYDLVKSYGTWSHVREVGPQARAAFAPDGIEAFMSVRDLPEGRLRVTMSRLSAYIPFPLERIARELNKLEPGWGGGDAFTCSPRDGGTALDLDVIIAIVEREVAREAH